MLKATATPLPFTQRAVYVVPMFALSLVTLGLGFVAFFYGEVLVAAGLAGVSATSGVEAHFRYDSRTDPTHWSQPHPIPCTSNQRESAYSGNRNYTHCPARQAHGLPETRNRCSHTGTETQKRHL